MCEHRFVRIQTGYFCENCKQIFDKIPPREAKAEVKAEEKPAEKPKKKTAKKDAK